MKNNASAGGTYGGSVEIKRTMELFIIGQAWVDEGSLEQVQSSEVLGKKLTPKTQGKGRINAEEGCKEIIF